MLQQLRAESSGAGIKDDVLQNLKRRKLVTQVTRKSYKVSKGPEFRLQRVKKHADLTKEMLEVLNLSPIRHTHTHIRPSNQIHT